MNGRSLAPVLADRRVWVFAGIAALSVALGAKLVPDRYIIDVVNKSAYWLVLAAFALFVRALWRSFRGDVAAARAAGAAGVDWASVAVVATGGLILVTHEPLGFKILMDDVMLVGSSLSMHLSRTVGVPIRGGNLQGAFVMLGQFMDKRQVFYPFLVSIIHDVTGYRVENAFYLNVALAFVFLALVNALGRKLCGRLAGWLGVALFAGLPLLAQNATGGGAELLNLVMILATLMLGARYIERRDSPALEAFCYSAMLMTQVRYESGIFLLPVFGTILWVWWLEAKATLTWPIFILPPLLIHCLLHTRVFDIRATFWQLEGRPGMTSPFSVRYVPNNLAHALAFFFGRPTDQPNSYVLSAFGCVGLIFFGLLALRRARRLSAESPASAASIIFAAGFAAQFALMMCYFWGQFDDGVIRRLSLPTHLWMVVSIMGVLSQFPARALTRVLLGVAVLGVLAQGVPSMAAHAYNQEYLAGLETAWRRQFIKDHPKRDYLVIDNDSILWLTDEVSSTTIESAQKRREDLEFLMRTNTYSAVYVFQTYGVDAATGKMVIRQGDDLGPDYVLETVRSERLVTLTQTRLSRLVEIRKGGKSASTPLPDVALPKDRAELDKAREAYLENFLKRLP